MVPHVKSGQTDATLPHKLFHYMYMKRPVVVTSCRPLERIVRGSACGLVCPSGNENAMADALIQLSQSPEERRRMGENGHRAVLERYNWDLRVQDMLRLYAEL